MCDTLANDLYIDEEEGGNTYVMDTKDEFFTSAHHDGSFEDIDETGREMNIRSAIDDGVDQDRSIELARHDDPNQMEYE